jgi:DNA-binding CsgD family transcriptional regulator
MSPPDAQRLPRGNSVLAPLELIERAYQAAAEPSRWPSWFDALATSIGHRASNVVIRGFGPTRYVDLDRPASGFGDLNPTHVFRHKGLSKSNFALACVSGEIVEEWSPVPSDSTAVQVFTDAIRILEQRERALLRDVLPHLHRALVLYFRIDAHRRDQDTLASCLDELTTGMILLDETATILHANQAALGYLDTHYGLARDGGKLMARDRDVNATLSDNLKRALSGRRRSLIGQPLECGLTLWLRGLGSDRAIAYIVNERHERLVPPALLRAAFDLTPAQARVGSLFALGSSVDEIAADLGISVHTVRLHVKAIQKKTGTHRQATLVRRMLETMPPVYP